MSGTRPVTSAWEFSFCRRRCGRWGPIGIARLTAYQLRLVYWELSAVTELEADFRALGISPAAIVQLGMDKQIRASHAVWDQHDEHSRRLQETISRALSAVCAYRFPPDEIRYNRRARVDAARQRWAEGPPSTRPASVEPPGTA